MEPFEFAGWVGVGFALAFAAVAWRPAWVIDGAAFVLAAIAGLCVLAGVALVDGPPWALDLRIDPSTEPLLPRGDPARAIYQRAIRDFGDDEVFVIAMETGDAFAPAALGALERVTDRLAHMPEVRRVQSLTDVVAFRYDRELDWIDVGDFIDQVPDDPGELAALRAEALADPLYRRTLISEDAGTAAINVTFRKLSDRDFIESRLEERIQEVLAQEAGPGIRFHVAGRSHIKHRVYHQMLRDMRLLIPLALGVVALGLGLVFGTRRGVVLPLAVILIATLWTFGAMAHLDRPLTVLTTLLAPMLSAIGSVYGIHALSRYEEEAAEAHDARGAALASLQHMRLPVLVAGLTTMIGFGALMLSDVPAVLEVGAFSVLGVASLTWLSLAGFHAALALLPLRRPTETRLSHAIHVGLDRLLARVSSLVARRATPLLGAFAIASVACALAIPSIRIDTDYLSFFAEDAPIRQEFDAVNRLLSGAVPIYVAIDAGEPGAFREPELLRAIERIQQAADQLPGVGRTLSLADTVRVMNRTMARDDPAEERIPDTRGGAAELIFMAPKGHLDRYTNVNHSRGNVLIRTGAVGTARVRELVERLEAIVAEAGLPEGVRADVTGNAILLSRSADGIARGQPRTVGLAALAIFVLVVGSFRSIRLGLVAMVPNVVPVGIYFGLLGFGIAPLSLPTSLIGSVALGIAVDDTAHFLVRYGTERRRGADPAEAAALCGRRIGRPIAITSIMLMAGFLVVGLSSFATLRQFGFLSAATMGICLLTDLLLLPALLIRTRA